MPRVIHSAERSLRERFVLIASSAQAQNLFVADAGSGIINEITPGGAKSPFAFEFSDASGLAFDSAGDLFVGFTNGIYEITPGRVETTFASGLSYPEGLAFNSAGDLFEADWGSGNIYEFTPGGVRSTFASGLSYPYGLAFNSAGDLFEADWDSGHIYEFTPGGARSTFATGLDWPIGLAFNSAGDLFEADWGSGHIYEFTPGGVRSTFASGLATPLGLAFNSAGDLFVTDYGSGNIYEFTPGGAQSTFDSGLSGPTFLAFQPVPGYVPSLPGTATASAVLDNGFVVGANITDGGSGYTNTPTVQIIGGGGSGAQAVGVVSNGVVIALNIMDAGYGYTNAPLVVIDPPFIPNPVLGIAPMSLLAFSNLTVGGTYQLQQSWAWYWTNQPVSLTATNALYTQMVAGVVGTGDYRLALNPVPTQAFATPQVGNGFVVGATVTSGGSGYVTSPAVTIVGGGGTNATAVSQISGGVVTNISITDGGIGYTNTPTVEIAQPPAVAVSPTVLPLMRLDSASLAPYDNYQIQFTPDIGGTWGNWNGGLFSPTNVTNSQYLFITNGTGFFRLQYVP